MTRDEIVDLADDEVVKYMTEEMLEFIVAMVARHNEELAKMAEVDFRGVGGVSVASAIREACPK